jgi:hypothetical protein
MPVVGLVLLPQLSCSPGAQLAEAAVEKPHSKNAAAAAAAPLHMLMCPGNLLPSAAPVQCLVPP